MVPRDPLGCIRILKFVHGERNAWRHLEAEGAVSRDDTGDCVKHKAKVGPDMRHLEHTRTAQIHHACICCWRELISTRRLLDSVQASHRKAA